MSPPIWEGLTAEEHEYQYNPQRSVPDFPGAILARPAGNNGRLPVVIVLGGSEGGAA